MIGNGDRERLRPLSARDCVLVWHLRSSRRERERMPACSRGLGEGRLPVHLTPAGGGPAAPPPLLPRP
ncbi:MAG TPA: hypothetical protein VKZ81_18535 [Pseudonocardia sp.]|uniref:hypothetical protein n=1 Tax=Pseudonocardia sp. TaxID=60912 RepID=UPI002B4B8229|nr:hypothetical protein [Pseudonocardia sp.]HLU57457.1 hypothetical protein [Pseudonocardia sp.]